MEASGGRFPVVLKLQQALGEEIQAREFVQDEDLSLHDRKVNLDLIEPTGMSGSMDEVYDLPQRQQAVALVASRRHSALVSPQLDLPQGSRF
jgi:hypothetical protein